MGYILASDSPRRQELLKLVVDDFKILPSEIDENTPADMPCELQPEYLAKSKAGVVASDFPNDIVIGADTSVIIDDIILGKPKDVSEAKYMLKLLSGRRHKVITGCSVYNKGKFNSFSVITEVEFYNLTDNEIESYISTGEPFDKAGAYGIQGYGALLVKAIHGDYFNVVGLPIARLKRVLSEI